MFIDNRLPLFKSFLSENKLASGGLKNSINQSAISAGENVNIDLNLKNDGSGVKSDKKSRKKNDKKPNLDLIKNNTNQELDPKQVAVNIKSINIKFLNLL
jgi:hypothetical protein